MVNHFFVFLLCLLFGAICAWFLYKRNQNLSKWLRFVLFGCRTITIALMCWLLFAPLIKATSYTFEKPIIILAHDNSLSISAVQKKHFNKLQYQKDMQLLASHLADNYDVQTFSFSDSIKKGFDFRNLGKESNASRFLTQLNTQFQNRNIGAIVIASDGIFNRGGNPLYDLNQFKAPIYTIALGDTTQKKDVMIGNVNYPEMVYLDNYFTTEVTVDAYLSKNENVVLRVMDNDKEVFHDKINMISNRFNRTIPIKLKAVSKGLHRFTMSVSNLDNEITYQNNTRTVFVEVIDGKQNILIASAFPHPDIAVLKRAIELDKHDQVKVVIGENLNAVDVNKFGLVILYQLPEKKNAFFDFINKVKDSKSAIWYFLGAGSNFHVFNQLQDLVNFQPADYSSVLQNIFPAANANFAAFVLDEKQLSTLNTFDPLQLEQGRLYVNGFSKVVFFQRNEAENTQKPLLFFMDDIRHKVGFFVGEGIWRWTLAEANRDASAPIVNDVVTKSVRYLTTKDDDKKKFKVYPSKVNFDENENAVLNAVLLNDNYQPVNNVDVNVEIKNKDNQVFNYSFTKVDNAYILDAGALPSGYYTYVANTTLGNQKHIAKGSFYVSALALEYQQTTANHQLLHTMAMQNNGKMYYPERLLQLEKDLANHQPLKKTTLSYQDLINYKWLFVLLLSLLTVEWLVRKLKGVV